MWALCICVSTLQMYVSVSASQLMKNFKVEYSEQEPFSVVQNVFLNADRTVPLKFSSVWAVMQMQLSNILICKVQLYLFVNLFQMTIYIQNLLWQLSWPEYFMYIRFSQQNFYFTYIFLDNLDWQLYFTDVVYYFL